MVFAIAALILQIAHAPKLVSGASANPSVLVASAANAEGAEESSGAENSDTRSSKSAESAAAQPNFSSVRLLNDPTENSSSSKLNLSAANLDNSGALSSIRIPAAQPIMPVVVTPAEKRRPTRSWLALAMATHGAAAFDAYSTRQAIGRGAVEDDPLMRPFAHSPAIYVASQVTPVLLDLLSRRMMRSEHPIFRRIWWVPQSGSSAMFIFSGVHNLGVASRQQ